MSCVYQNIDPPPLSPPGECVPPVFVAGGGHTRWVERGVGGQYFGRRKTQLCTLPISNPLCLTLYRGCELAYPYDWSGFVGAQMKTSVGLLVLIISRCLRWYFKPLKALTDHFGGGSRVVSFDPYS